MPAEQRKNPVSTCLKRRIETPSEDSSASLPPMPQRALAALSSAFDNGAGHGLAFVSSPRHSNTAGRGINPNNGVAKYEPNRLWFIASNKMHCTTVSTYA